MSAPQPPKPKKGKSLLGSALASGLGTLDDPAVATQLHQGVRPPLTDSESTPETTTPPLADLLIDLDQLEPTADQARTRFEASELEELAESIREKGLLQPVLVRPTASGRYQILAGERRWRAAKLAGLIKIPAYVRDLDDATSREISLIENMHRAELNRIERLEKVLELIGHRFAADRDWAIAALRQAWAQKQGRRSQRPVASTDQLEDLGKYLSQLGVGLSNLVVSSLPSLAWPAVVYQAVAGGRIGIRYAEVIVKQPMDRQAALVELAATLDWETFSAGLSQEGRPAQAPAETDLASLNQRLQQRFGSEAMVSQRGGKTTVTVVVTDDQALARLRKALKF